MNLNDALTALAAQANLDAHDLIAYAEQDEIGGFNFDPAQSKWGGGSIWEVEGKVLHALVRGLKAQRVGEFGTHEGCGATHILSGLFSNGEVGVLISVDPWEGAGRGVPQSYRQRWTMVFARGTEWLEQQDDASFDLLFEDMVHGADDTRDWWRVALRKIRPGGVIISHDAAHFNVGADVMRGIGEAGVQATVYAIDPSDCGLAVYVVPGAAVMPTEIVVNLTPEEIQEAKELYEQHMRAAEDEYIQERKEAERVFAEQVAAAEDEAMRQNIEQLNDLDAIVHEPVIVEDDELPPAPKAKPTPRKPSKRKTGGKG